MTCGGLLGSLGPDSFRRSDQYSHPEASSVQAIRSGQR